MLDDVLKKVDRINLMEKLYCLANPVIGFGAGIVVGYGVGKTGVPPPWSDVGFALGYVLLTNGAENMTLDYVAEKTGVSDLPTYETEGRRGMLHNMNLGTIASGAFFFTGEIVGRGIAGSL